MCVNELPYILCDECGGRSTKKPINMSRMTATRLTDTGYAETCVMRVSEKGTIR